MAAVKDECSRSNADVVQINHLEWNVDVDFDQQQLMASATYSLSEPTTTLILDTNDLCIEGATVFDEDTNVSFQLLPPVPNKPHLGRALVIQFSMPTKTVTVQYKTTRSCSAIQWLPPEQTAGKVHPYLYTQCQAIHARSLVPCQDVTGVKFTYTATITTPSWATAVCSALHQSTTESQTTNTTAVWNQPVPISSYLLALAVGELERVELGHRCAVYSEPSVVQAAAYEFAGTEEMVATAERITGIPYPWGRYDLLCLPPSFSFGGMENPNMTFVTPTLLAGDRSLVDVVAHEIAHSWTGNYVTCATWNDFWLNEGWTVFLERKMTSYGKPRKFLDFAALGGYHSLQNATSVMEKRFTALVLPIGDEDPDEAYSAIAYEKGFTFLLYLERLVGEDKFGKFLHDYLQSFAGKTITSAEFREYVQDYFDQESIREVDWDKWYHATGLPPVALVYDQSMIEESKRLAQDWVNRDRKGGSEPATSIARWTSNQITCFLDELLELTERRPLTKTTVHALRSQYKFDATKNAEVLFRYCKLAIAAEDETAVSVTVRFITSQGRMKYIRPLYKALFKSKMGMSLATKTFVDNMGSYHPIAAKMVAADLKLTGNQSSNKLGEILGPIAATGLVAVAVGAALIMLRKRR